MGGNREEPTRGLHEGGAAIIIIVTATFGTSSVVILSKERSLSEAAPAAGA
jgi:hypothetical protein